ncbi:MAG: hypothetical protein EOP48_28415, partial [Sphingobacteriales bacterium]
MKNLGCIIYCTSAMSLEAFKQQLSSWFKLEQVTISFFGNDCYEWIVRVNKEFDVLLCTTIIESGLDIPSANTIIIDQVHLLGLAQLYQLRGRVGRTDIQAYAYFTYPENMKLT